MIEIDKVDPEVGYTVALESGTAPENLGQILMPVIPDEGGTLTLVWSDEISDEQPPVDFTLLVTAIAPNGDQGPTRQVVVSDPGSDGGCSSTGHQDASLLGLIGFGMFFLWRRRE